MTRQQMVLKTESFLVNADKRLLDSFPILGGRMRLFAGNPDNYVCNYGVINEWLDVDKTIEAAETEFAGRNIAPCRFYGAPDSLAIEELRPAFARHGYAVRVLDECSVLAAGAARPAVEECGFALEWAPRLTPEQADYMRKAAGGEFGLRHVRRLQRSGAAMLFACGEGGIVAAALYYPAGDTVMFSDLYTPLAGRPAALVRRMAAEMLRRCAEEERALVFVQAADEATAAACRKAGFETLPMPPVWWAVKGELPPNLRRQ